MKVSQKLIDQVLASPGLRADLRQIAERKLPRARQIAIQSGRPFLAGAMRVETGVRPGEKSQYGAHRPYARIIAKVSDADRRREAHTAKLSRLQVMRRVASG